MARGRAKDKAKDEADAAADAAAGGVSGTAGAVTEEAQKFAHAAGDAVSSVAGTVADSAKGAVSAVTSAVSGAVEKARAYPAKGSPSGEGAARGSPSHDAARTPDRNEANARKTFRTLPNFFLFPGQVRQQPSSISINPPTNPPHPTPSHENRRAPRLLTSTRTAKWTPRTPPRRPRPSARDAPRRSASSCDPERRETRETDARERQDFFRATRFVSPRVLPSSRRLLPALVDPTPPPHDLGSSPSSSTTPPRSSPSSPRSPSPPARR